MPVIPAMHYNNPLNTDLRGGNQEMLNRALGAVCAALLGALALVLVAAPSYWPSPAFLGEESHKPQSEADRFHKKTSNAERSAELLVCKFDIFDAQKDQRDATDKQTEQFCNAAPDWWSIGIGIVTALILLLQTAVFGRQAFRLRQSVNYMRSQGDDMRESIAQAGRAADAMESVARGIGETVATNRTVVENQKDFWARQMRAYVSTDTGADRRQRRSIRFEFRPVIANNGQTPANNLRVSSKCEVRTPSIPADFDFSVRTDDVGAGSATTMFPRQTKFHSNVFNRRCSVQEMRGLLTGRLVFHLYGRVTYTDIFEQERFTNFSYFIFIPTNKRGSTIWRTTDQHNDAN